MAWNSNDVSYIKLGLSAGFLIEPKYAKYMNTLKEWYDEGIITDVTFLVFGKWNSKTIKRLVEILKENNNEWAENHLVFKLKAEFDAGFILRNIRCLKISHYVDMDRNHIQPVVMSRSYKNTKIFYWHDDAERGWTEMKAWLKRHNPAYFALYEPGEQSDFIIQTGIGAEPELEEAHTSEVYEDEAWLGF